ncbi:P pilus assembly protein, chaperone PapD [Herbaspirillum sp. CF444]|nr:P pilus assembly protein, chaperone PapD [Herbaspirillum sp. CF444]
MRLIHWFSCVLKRMAKRRQLCLAAWLIACSGVALAGVMADRTRVIFSDGAQAQSVTLVNTNDYPVMLQIWVDNGEGSSIPDTIVSSMFVMPAVFRLQSHEVKSIRVLYTGDVLPAGRESLSWLNLYEIPILPAGDQNNDTPRVLLGLNTQIKIFYRPEGLQAPAGSIATALDFQIRRKDEQWFVVCHNRSAYFASFGGMAVQAGDRQYPIQQLPDMMTPPMGEGVYPIAAEVGVRFDRISASLNYTLIDDSGNLVAGAAKLNAVISADSAANKE